MLIYSESVVRKESVGKVTFNRCTINLVQAYQWVVEKWRIIVDKGPN